MREILAERTLLGKILVEEVGQILEPVEEIWLVQCFPASSLFFFL